LKWFRGGSHCKACKACDYKAHSRRPCIAIMSGSHEVRDYSCELHCAEDAADAAIETILTNCGNTLWNKYLERKAFRFAAEASTEAITAQLEMCFVPHDAGEDSASDDDRNWSLEDEPQPGNIDNWARMQLPVRKRHRGPEDFLSGGSRGRNRLEPNGRMPLVRSRTLNEGRAARKNTSGNKDRPDSSSARASPLEEELHDDTDEEKLRDAKRMEEAQQREQERRARESQKDEENKQKEVEILHVEMESKPHTFDLEGNIIWIEDVKPEKLPVLQQVAGFVVKKDPRNRTLDNLGGTKLNSSATVTSTAPVAARQRLSRGGRKETRDKNKAKEPEFTDFYSKLQYGQPPIVDTMVVSPGVTLESMGRRKLGPDIDRGAHQMSRAEYVELAEREAASDNRWGEAARDQKTSGPAAAKGGGNTNSGTAPTPAGRPLNGGAATEEAGPATGGGTNSRGLARSESAPAAQMQEAGRAGVEGNNTATLSATQPLPPVGEPSVVQGSASMRRRQPVASAATGADKGGRKVNTEPLKAPMLYTRSKKYDAVGHLGRLPRYHVP